MNANCLKYGHDWAKIGNYVQCIAHGCFVQRVACTGDKPEPAKSHEHPSPWERKWQALDEDLRRCR